MPSRAYDELDWRTYQRLAAEFFDKLEMDTEIEAKIDGARSTHAVDVAVRFTSYGIDHLWIVECKLWRQKVHKEQVLALRGVVDDVGGDCGFLLSETGFDPAAVTAARMSNVTLTNLEDLDANAAADIQGSRWQHTYTRVTRCKHLADRCAWFGHPEPKSTMFKPGMDMDDYTFNRANLSFLESGLAQVKLDHLPIPYGVERPSELRWARSQPEFFDRAAEVLDEIEPWLEKQDAKPWPES